MIAEICLREVLPAGGAACGGAAWLADERSRSVKASLSHDHELIHPQIQDFWDTLTGHSG